MMNLIVIALSLTTGAPAKTIASHMTVTQPRAGSYQVTYSSEHSKKAHNDWDRLGFSADEGNNGKLPTIAKKSL